MLGVSMAKKFSLEANVHLFLLLKFYFFVKFG